MNRNENDFLCPTFSFNVSYDSKGCGVVIGNVSNTYFEPISFQWSNGENELNMNGPLESGSYTLRFNETGANGCIFPILYVDAPSCIIAAQAIESSSRLLSTNTIIIIGKEGKKFPLFFLIVKISIQQDRYKIR